MVVIVDELSYTKDHLWARVEGELFVIGITDYAQKKLGEAVYVELPQEGAAIARDEMFGSVESITSMADFYSPVSGEIAETNEVLGDAPQTINSDPYGGGWLIKVRPYNPDEIYDMVDSDEYREFLEEEEGG